MIRKILGIGLFCGAMGMASQALSHGDVSPQPIDTTGLKSLGDAWLTENPYRGNELAIKIGKTGFNQNCARCHGLGAVSGGIAPDLRRLDRGKDGDDYFIGKVRTGAIRNGVTYMPRWEGTISQEAMWAIRSWLDTVATDD